VSAAYPGIAMIASPTHTVIDTPSTASTQQTMTATGSTALAPR
jgi:hypothetical protein